MRHPLLCRGVSQQRKPKGKQGAAAKTHCLLTRAGKQGQAFLAKGEQKKINQLWATKVVFPSPWALLMIPNLCNCPRFPQMLEIRPAWQGPWLRRGQKGQVHCTHFLKPGQAEMSYLGWEAPEDSREMDGISQSCLKRATAQQPEARHRIS